MPRSPLPPLHATFRLLRQAMRWSQSEASSVLGAPSQVAEIENGRRALTRAELDGFAERIRAPVAVVPVLLGIVEALHPARAEEETVELSPETLLEAERTALEAATRAREGFLAAARAERVRKDREAAKERVRALLAIAPHERAVVVATAESFQTWAIVEALAEESIHAAPRSEKEALALARLARDAAERVRGGQAFRYQLRGYAEAHCGNALRVANDLRGAEAAFARARELWGSDEERREGPLEPARVAALEASLRRDQRRFEEARALLERALVLADPKGREHAWIVLSLSFLLDQLDEPQLGVKLLREILPAVDTGPARRQSVVARFNLAVHLVALGEWVEARQLVVEIRELAALIGSELDLWRVEWLAARLDSAEGESEKAIQRLERVAEQFVSRGLGYDAALATLDSAVIYLERGEAIAARERVAAISPAFRAQGIAREELASLRLFLEALRAERATAGLARTAADAWRRWGRDAR